MSQRKFTKGSYAKIHPYGWTPEYIRNQWQPVIDRGGYIKVLNERSSGYYQPTWYYNFALYNHDGEFVDSHETTAHYFDVDNNRKEDPPVRTPKERLQEQIKQQNDRVQQAKDTVKKENNKLVDLQSKLAFMEDNDLEVFNEKEYQAYRVLQVIEEQEDLGRMEKAKLIAKIVE